MKNWQNFAKETVKVKKNWRRSGVGLLHVHHGSTIFDG